MKPLDYTLIVFTTFNLVGIVLEVIIFKVYLGRGVNLDRRIKLKETHRIKKNSAYFGLSLLLFSLVFIVPKFVTHIQPCNFGFYS